MKKTTPKKKQEKDKVKSFLEEVVKGIGGEGSEKLVELLYKKQNVNEFLIAKKLVLTINQTRNILYKLADEGLVTFIRKKDKKKGGWYTYFWTIKTKKSLQNLKEGLDTKKEELNAQLKAREGERRFYCKNCDLEYTEEDAMNIDYACSECGEVLEIRETEKITIGIKEEMKKIQSILEKIKIEIELIEQQEQKTQQRKISQEIKIKEEERREKRRLREKEKAKINKKLGIKKINPRKKKKEKPKKVSKISKKKKK